MDDRCASSNCNLLRQSALFNRSQPSGAAKCRAEDVVRGAFTADGLPVVDTLPLGSLAGSTVRSSATTRRGGIDDAGLPIAGSKRLGNRALDSLQPCVRQEFLCP